MAAPAKVGLDYFSFDVDLLRDRKLRRPKMRHGYLATVVYIALLSIIYEDKGYYVEYGDDNSKDDVIWQIQEYLQGKHQPSYDTVADVIDDLVACELFSNDLYQAGIITSRRTQRTYYSATVSRKAVDIDKSIWLLTLEEMEKLSAKHCYYLYLINRPHNEVNQPNNDDNQADNEQSKQKETKRNKSKGNYYHDKDNDIDNIGAEECLQYVEERQGRQLTAEERQRIEDMAAEFGWNDTLRIFKKRLG